MDTEHAELLLCVTGECVNIMIRAQWQGNPQEVSKQLERLRNYLNEEREAWIPDMKQKQRENAQRIARDIMSVGEV